MILPLVVLRRHALPRRGSRTTPSASPTCRRGRRSMGRCPRARSPALRTDMYKDWDTDPRDASSAARSRAWSFETIKYLFEQRGVTAIGHEACGHRTRIARGQRPAIYAETLASAHCSSIRSHYQIEVMANLDQVPATGAVIVVTWPKVENGFGFPAPGIRDPAMQPDHTSRRRGTAGPGSRRRPGRPSRSSCRD